MTAGAGVAIRDTSHGQQLGGDRSSNKTRTTGGRHEAHADGTALSGELARDSVGLSEGGTPVATADRDDGSLGKSNSAADGVGNFARALDAEANVAVAVADGNEGLEARTLTGRGLLLDGHDLKDFVLEALDIEDSVNDFGLLDGEGEQVDLLEGSDELLLHEAAKLGDRGPLLLLVTATTSASATATTSATTSTVTTTTAETAFAAEATALTLSGGGVGVASGGSWEQNVGVSHFGLEREEEEKKKGCRANVQGPKTKNAKKKQKHKNHAPS